MRTASPLRYPGGKWRITSFFERLIAINGLHKCRYVEAYAGGASLALSLLFNESVAEIHLNDLDDAIFSFWHSVLYQNKDFLTLLGETEPTSREWHRQRAFYLDSNGDSLKKGFATFFLNRTNYSGILNGGMIGGKNQSGKWALDARYNKASLRDRIERIYKERGRIHISCKDAIHFLKTSSFDNKTLIYLDPPYFKNGKRLYHNAYGADDHEIVSKYISKVKTPWIVSYDDVPEIKRLYKSCASRKLKLLHTARESRSGSEVLFFNSDLRIPRLTT